MMLFTPVAARVSSPFGWRWNGQDWHGGVDFGAPLGSPVYAAHSGTVVNVWPDGALSKYGRVIVIKHDEPAPAPYSLYAHLGSSLVGRGDSVSRGQKIGTSGDTAASSTDANRKVPPHLHFELLSKWPPPAPDTYRVDPTEYLDPAVFPNIMKPVSIGIGTLVLLGGGAYWLWKRLGRR